MQKGGLNIQLFLLEDSAYSIISDIWMLVGK